MNSVYASQIQEDGRDLLDLEKDSPDKAGTDRLRFLRFLKEGRAHGVEQAASLLGYAERTLWRWWKLYREGGVAALRTKPPPRGPVERVTAAAWTGLCEAMRAGQIGSLHEAQVYLRESWHIDLGIDAISKLFQRRKTKLKTGHPRYRKAPSPAEQSAFKK